MKEIHLQYQKETGIRISEELIFVDDWGDLHKISDYITWLEERIETAEKYTKHLEEAWEDI